MGKYLKSRQCCVPER